MKDDYNYTQYDSGVNRSILPVMVSVAVVVGGVLWYLFTH